MSSREKNRMRHLLVSEIAHKFGLTNEESNYAVENSVFEKMIKTSPEFVGHYSIDYWVDNTYLEYQGIPTT